MKKIGKVIAIVVGVVLAVLIAAVVALMFLIDPNDYKNQIAATVKQHTGRELTLRGKIGLSFFPWLGVELKGVELSNAAGFGPEPFAKVEALGVKVRVLPLLKGQVMVDKVLLSGLNLQLAQDRRGRTNWQDLARPSPAAAAQAPAAGQLSTPSLPVFEIGGVDVSKSELRWHDLATGADYRLQNLTLKTGEIADAKPTTLKLTFDLTSQTPPLKVPVALNARVLFESARQRLTATDLKLDMAGLSLSGEVHGSKIPAAPEFRGRVTLAPFNPREVLEKFGVRLETTDKNALRRAAVGSQFQASGQQVRLTDFSATLDDSKLGGSASIANFAQPAYRFDLTLDQFDLDRYLPPASTKPAPAGKPPATPKAEPAPIEIPLDAIRKLDAEGRFRIGQFKAFDARSNQVLIALNAKNGLVRLTPTEAKLYGGAYQGGVSYDARTQSPVLTIDEQLNGIQLGPLLKDMFKFEAFTGNATMKLKVTSRGLEPDAIKAALNGTTQFFIKDGVIRGIDLVKLREQIRQAKANKEAALDALKRIVPQKGDETKFSQLNASSQIKNGIAFNDDLTLQVQGLVAVRGKGRLNLVKGIYEDYRVMVEDIPIIVSGPLNDPQFRPDVEAIASAWLKDEGRKRLNEELQKRGGNEELQKKLDEKLKRIFK